MTDLGYKIFFKVIRYGFFQIKPIDPAVNPTTKKNANSDKSRGIEFTIKLS
tara:strand:+ start:223 stop:375 length:153 start_codon:yes stop_codon:yes gene_type:complete